MFRFHDPRRAVADRATAAGWTRASGQVRECFLGTQLRLVVRRGPYHDVTVKHSLGDDRHETGLVWAGACGVYCRIPQTAHLPLAPKL